MYNRPLREIFGALLASGRFNDCHEEQGNHYRQAHFHSPRVTLRIAEQQEITARGESVTCLAFLVDPKNANRWCMFEKAIEAMLGKKIEGSDNLIQLQQNVDANIDLILQEINQGKEPPFQDFSQFQ